MKDIEFQEIGKRTPYHAPNGFFEQISEKTLQQAKLREQSHRKKLILWRTMAVAASLAAIVFIGYLTFQPEHPDNKLIVQKNQAQIEPAEEPKSEKLKEPAVAISKENPVTPTTPEVKNPENMTEVLTDLTDEELMQLAAVYKADPFIEEAVQ